MIYKKGGTKMKKKINLGLLLLILILSLLLVGCGKSNTVVGKWLLEEEGVEVEFYKDGKVKISEGNSEDRLEYEILSDSELTIGDGFEQPDIMDYYFENGDLYMDDTRFTRK